MGKKRISTKEVLKTIAAIGGGAGIIILSAAIPGLPLGLATVVKAWKEINRKDLGRIIKRLEKQEMIAINEWNDKISIEITDKGKRRLLEYNFETIQLKTKRRDGKWRLVIFDIPEDKKAARDVFRRKLLQLGLIRFQDSVFVSAFPCKNEVEFLCHFLEISDYVTIIEIGRVERGEQLIFKHYREWDN